MRLPWSGPHFHDNTLPPAVLIQIKGGQITAVAPPKFAHAKFEYPLSAI